MFGKKKNFYITTTLPYVNAEPHLGFALEIVQADVIARWHRERGDNVFFNTGTDEHGLKIYRKAQQEKIEPQAYCDILAKKFDDLKKILNLSYNSFVRTTDEGHIKIAQEFWQRCQKAGDIYKKNYKIKYCIGCELEKTESELENNRCPIHPDQELEIIEEENYFFRYSKYQKKLLDLYERNKHFVLPESRLNEIKEFTKRGLEDFSISRLKEKMPWGVAVPGDEKQVIYVWFDALTNYISCLGWPNDKKKFRDFWPGIQIAGKDNLRQQASMWQAMLMSAGLKPAKQILIHGFITANGQKMSKSLGNVVEPFELVNKYGTDAVRYYLLREFSPFEDGDYTDQKFEERYNADLANGLGNLVARVITLSAKLKIKNGKGKVRNGKLEKLIRETEKKCGESLEGFKFNEALAGIWSLISFCDKYINETKPWEDKKGSAEAIQDLMAALREIAALIKPFLPQTSEKVIKQIETGQSNPLFPRLDKDF